MGVAIPDQTSGPSKSLSFLLRQAGGEYLDKSVENPTVNLLSLT